MPKETPIMELIEKLNFDKEGTGLDTEYDRGFVFGMRHAIKLLTSKLPAEREMIEEAYRSGKDDAYARPWCDSKKYFNETFKSNGDEK